MVSIETYDRWTPAGDWERNVQQLRCINPKQANKEACPVIRLVAGQVPTVAKTILSTPDPAPTRKEIRKAPKRKVPAAINQTHKRNTLIVRTCVDCLVPSKPMKLRSDAQQEWRCKPCYSHKYNKERIRTDR